LQTFSWLSSLSGVWVLVLRVAKCIVAKCIFARHPWWQAKTHLASAKEFSVKLIILTAWEAFRKKLKSVLGNQKSVKKTEIRKPKLLKIFYHRNNRLPFFYFLHCFPISDLCTVFRFPTTDFNPSLSKLTNL